jgi:hypothetical protein
MGRAGALKGLDSEPIIISLQAIEPAFIAMVKQRS